MVTTIPSGSESWGYTTRKATQIRGVIAEGEGNTKWIKKGREGKDQWQSRDQLQFVPLTPPSKFPLKKRAPLAFWRSFLEKVYEEDSL